MNSIAPQPGTGKMGFVKKHGLIQRSITLGREMMNDLSEHKFAGTVYQIAEKEFAASFDEDKERMLVKQIYDDYKNSGSPRDTKNWIRSRLQSLFLCVEEKPSWVERRPEWPFMNGKPMIFIQQIAVKENEVSGIGLAVGAILYVFGCRTTMEYGWKTEYRVIEQLEELRGR